MGLRSDRGRAGLTLMELMIALGVIAVLFLGVLSMIYSTARLNDANREQTIAWNAVRAQVELARNQEFRRIFALYNADPADDPDGPGTAPGARFAVDGLRPLPSAPGGRAGRIAFPVIAGALREDYVDAALEMPHDLNGDGAIDSLDHRGDYRILPVTVTVEWQSPRGPSRFVYRTRFIPR